MRLLENRGETLVTTFSEGTCASYLLDYIKCIYADSFTGGRQKHGDKQQDRAGVVRTPVTWPPGEKRPHACALTYTAERTRLGSQKSEHWLLNAIKEQQLIQLLGVITVLGFVFKSPDPTDTDYDVYGQSSFWDLL